jgi:hypothetical protein
VDVRNCPRDFEKVQDLRRIVSASHDNHEGIRASKERPKPVYPGRQA